MKNVVKNVVSATICCIERQLRCRKKALWADKKFSVPVAIVKDFRQLPSALVKPLGCIGAPSEN